MHISEVDYYRHREQQERAAASNAADQTTRDIHFMMAERYADRAWSLAELHLHEGGELRRRKL